MRISLNEPGRADGKAPEPSSRAPKDRAPMDNDRWSDQEQRIMRAIARSTSHWRFLVL